LVVEGGAGEIDVLLAVVRLGEGGWRHGCESGWADYLSGVRRTDQARCVGRSRDRKRIPRRGF
jgi:hypothetical protein